MSALDELLRSEEHFRRLARELAVRNRIADVFLTTPDHEAFGRVLATVLESLDSTYGVFGFIDDLGCLVVPALPVGPERDLAGQDRGHSFPPDTWEQIGWLRALREQRTFYSNEPLPAAGPGDVPLDRHITVPLLHQDRSVGLLQVANKSTDYMPEDVALLETIGRAVAPVLDARVTRDRQESARRRAEDALVRSEERLLALKRSAAEALTLWDSEFRLIDLNEAALKYAPSGIERSDLLGRSLDVLEPEVIPSGRLDKFKEVIRTGVPFFARNMALHVEFDSVPSSRFFDIVAFKVGDGLGIMTTDVTERKAAEDENERMRIRSAQAQKMEALGRLAGTVAHDFNNLLTVILGRVELALARADLPEPVRSGLGEAQTAGLRSAEVIRQLLMFAREQAVTPRTLDLNVTVAGFLPVLRRLIGESCELAWTPGPHLWPVRIDLTQIVQILTNLAVNARDALGQDGQIRIETLNVEVDSAPGAGEAQVAAGGYVALEVSDNGCGMSSEVLDRAFEPFFTTKPLGQGTGLGLATVHGIVKQNDGQIVARSEPGQGTTFTIYLPRWSGAPESSPAS